jgi:xanthine dehydrogenase molybdopterin-binding subunit B
LFIFDRSSVPTFNLQIQDEPIMVSLNSTVQYAGQCIAIVLAQTQIQANNAALAVTATYSNQQTPILSISDAKANPTRGFFNYSMPPLSYGNAQNAMATAPNVVSVSFGLPFLK